MSGFSAEWLTLREPYDLKARNATVLDAVAGLFVNASSIAVVDLACGTGATLRALSPRLPARQNWRLVDNDLSLLARASTPYRPPHLTVNAQPVDLARDLELALDGSLQLVTASALLDLVSEDWLERLVVEAAVRKLPVYAALTYNGRISLVPADPFDVEIIAAVNRHQCTDKGFGPALGPDAARQAATLFERVSYDLLQGLSDWMFGPQDRAIQSEMLSGWAKAAGELGDVPRAKIAGWRERRNDLVAAGRSHMRVGHVDLLATPIGMR